MTALLATAASLSLVGQCSQLLAEPGDQTPVVVQDRLEPTVFSPEELKLLQRLFGVHGPQMQLAQLFTSGVDQLQPLRASILDRLRELKPVILCQTKAHQVNPMLITAVLFDEIQHSKPGENLPFIAHSGLVKPHGPAQISVSELIHQNRLPANPTQEEITWARNQLLDHEMNITLLAFGLLVPSAALAQVDAEMETQCRVARDFYGSVRAFTTLAQNSDDTAPLAGVMGQVAAGLVSGPNYRNTPTYFSRGMNPAGLVEGILRGVLA